MTESIQESRVISASLDKIWNIIADVDNDSKYWQGLNTINNVSKNGNTVERYVTVGFRNSKGRQSIVLNPKKSILIKLKEGPIIGSKITTLFPIGDNKTRIDVSWKIEKWQVPFFARFFIQKQILDETKQALAKIAENAER